VAVAIEMKYPCVSACNWTDTDQEERGSDFAHSLKANRQQARQSRWHSGRWMLTTREPLSQQLLVPPSSSLS
jgi:hypothetical protein